jgi:CubicO group peptidase (beta-lactamase class C family)
LKNAASSLAAFFLRRATPRAPRKHHPMRPPLPLVLFAALTATAKPPADLQARLDAWNQGESGGLAVAWVDADGTVFAQSGRFGAGDDRAITPDTHFQIGSVTKVFTALLLAETERAGRVKRDDPAAKYLLPAGDPDQSKLAGLTLLTLTTHTAGLPRVPTDFTEEDRKDYTREKLVAALRRDGAAAKPGSPVLYSNFGVQLLGQSLAAAWGTTYAAALEAHVLAPLTLRSTSLALVGVAPPPDLAPAQVNGQSVPAWTFDSMAPSGALVSSARELAAFLAFCLSQTDSPLRPALVETMKPQRPVPNGGHIGFGWFITADRERPVYWHNGATAGYHAFLAFCPATGRGVAFLANSNKSSDALGRALLDGTPAPATPPAAAAATVAGYAGTYPIAPRFVLTVTEENGALFVQATNQPRNHFAATGPDEFALGASGVRVSFLRNGAGQVTALVLRQRNIPDQVALRQP